MHSTLQCRRRTVIAVCWLSVKMSLGQGFQLVVISWLFRTHVCFSISLLSQAPFALWKGEVVCGLLVLGYSKGIVLAIVLSTGLSALITILTSEPLMCVSAEVPANIAKYLPETLLAKSLQSSIVMATKVSIISEPVLDHEQSSPICPRPLKHRRITPTALPASPPQSVQKPLIVPTALSVPATNSQRPRRITPIALAEDSPSISGDSINPGIADALLASQTTSSSVQAGAPSESPCSSQEVNHVTSSVLEVSSSGPNKRLRITPIPIPADTPLSLYEGPALIEKLSAPFPGPLNCDQNTKFRAIEACLQGRCTDITVSSAAE